MPENLDRGLFLTSFRRVRPRFRKDVKVVNFEKVSACLFTHK